MSEGMDPDEQIEAALKDGLSEDRPGIDSSPVCGGLASGRKPRYAALRAAGRYTY
jgi:hypothetical protein